MENPKDFRWHLGHLDALRGIAVLGVLVVHSAFFLHTSRRVAILTFTGQRGVQLFFIVSAFTLFMSNDNRKQEHNPHLNFVIRRLFRLFPMFYIATALSCIFTPQYAGPPKDVILSLLFLHGFSSRAIVHGALGGWSVATEAIFYMSLPLLFRMIRSLSSAIWLLFVSTPVCYFACHALTQRYPETGDYFPFYWFPVNLPVFAMGIVSYFLWKKYIAVPRGQASPAHRELSILLLGLAAALYKMNLPFTYVNLYGCSLIGAVLLIGLSLRPWALLVNRFTIFMGEISFSIYLLHEYILLRILHVVQRTELTQERQFFVIFFCTLAVVVPISAVTWRFIEVPGINLGRRLIAKLQKRESATSKMLGSYGKQA